MVAGLALLVVLAPLELTLRGRRQSDLARTRVAFAGATLVGLVWSYRVFNGWADALMLVPFAALGLGRAGLDGLGVRPLAGRGGGGGCVGGLRGLHRPGLVAPQRRTAS